MRIFDSKKKWLIVLSLVAGIFSLSACDQVAVQAGEAEARSRDVDETPDTPDPTEDPLAPTSPILLSLDDVNGDGIHDIAVVVDDAVGEKLTATVKDINGRLIKNIPYNGKFRLLTAQVLPDMNGDGAMELAVFSQRPDTGELKAEIRDPLTGGLTRDIWYNSEFQLLFSATVADMNGNSYPEIVALFKGPEPDQRLFGQIRDPLTGELINNVYFDNQFTSRDFISLPDIDNTGMPELALLSENSNGEFRTIVRDAQSKLLVNHKWYGNQFLVKQLAAVDDMNGNSSEELAVLRESESVNVLIYDAVSGARINVINFNPLFTAQKLVVVSDFSGNGAAELAVLGYNTDTGDVKSEVRDTTSGELLSNVWWTPLYLPIDTVSIPDSNNNGSQELVYLGQRESDGKLLVLIKDSKTNQLLGTVGFQNQP